MIDTIYLDMDGVLDDFDHQVDNVYHARKANGKCNWDIIHKIGSTFWTTIPWLDEGKKSYQYVLEFAKKNNLKVGVLSAISFKHAKLAKRQWLEANCPEIDKDLVIICDKGVDKWNHLPENGILIDDTQVNIDKCHEVGKAALLYTNTKQLKKDLDEVFRLD